MARFKGRRKKDRYDETYSVKFEGVKEVDALDMFQMVVSFSCNHLEVVRKVLEVARKGGKINCPFPFECSEFPCETLSCNANALSNGHAIHAS